ncbi:Clustered mitochondria protein-like [Hondaea fermentalgiana]|uniref:Clustered mitochondria protein-like n=1 Tax=Hondaea fermentalgiana TaxID=2315210 RepID=A0A2R5G2B1_9STRA|nr:Clustered mitochondria protein-like [Hondaea fermentalgiana]|eukprot:GBG25167.1 Clustered mitochondria protein-like [Hondaea fermentalgiana]
MECDLASGRGRTLSELSEVRTLESAGSGSLDLTTSPLQRSLPLTPASSTHSDEIDEILAITDSTFSARSACDPDADAATQLSIVLPAQEDDIRVRHTIEFVLADIVERVVAAHTVTAAQTNKLAAKPQHANIAPKRGLYKIDTGYDIKVNLAGPSRAAPEPRRGAPEPLSHDSDASSIEDLEKALQEILVDEGDDDDNDLNDAHNDAERIAAACQDAFSTDAAGFEGAMNTTSGSKSAAPGARPEAVDRPAMVKALDVFPSKSNIMGGYIFGGLPSDSESNSDSDSLSSAGGAPQAKSKAAIKSKAKPRHYHADNFDEPHAYFSPASGGNNEKADSQPFTDEVTTMHASERPDAVERPILAGDDIFPDRSTLEPDTVVFGGLPDVDSEVDSLSSTSTESLDAPSYSSSKQGRYGRAAGGARAGAGGPRRAATMETQERGAEANAELLALHRIDETSTRLQQQGKYLEALECMERGLVLRQHFFGPSSDEVWAACKTVGQMCNLLAMTYLQQEEFSMVLELLKKAEILTERDEHGRAVTYNNLACYFRRTGKLHAALQYLQKALKVESRLENVTNRADTHLNLCAVLSQLGRHAGALEHAQAALIQLQEELFPGALSASAKSSSSAALASTDRIAVLAIAYHNIGVEQEFLKRFEMAIDSYRKGVDISETHLGTDHGITVTLRNSYLAARQAAESARARRGPAAKPSRRVAPKKTAKTAKRSPRLQQREERRWSDIQKAYGDVSAGLKPDPAAGSEFNLHVDYQEQQLELQMQRDKEEERRLQEESQAEEQHDGEGKVSDDAFRSSHHSLMAKDDQEFDVNETHQDPEDEEKSGEAEEPESPVGASSRNTSRAPSLQRGIAETGDAGLSENLASARAELASVHDLITPRDESALEILENEAAAAAEATNKSSISMREDVNDEGVEEKGDDDDEREIDDAREGKMGDDMMEDPERESKYAEEPTGGEDQGDQEEKSEDQTEKPRSAREESTKSTGDTTQDEEKSTSSDEEKHADIVENLVPEEHEYDDDDDNNDADEDDGNDNIEEKHDADSGSAPAESKSEEAGTEGEKEDKEQTNVEMATDIEESTPDANVANTEPQNEKDGEEKSKDDGADHQRDCKKSGMNEDFADGEESASLSPTNEEECDQENEESKQAEQVSGGNDKDTGACAEGSA